MKTNKLIKTISLNPAELRELADLIESSSEYSNFGVWDDQGKTSYVDIYAEREETKEEKKERLAEARYLRKKDKEYEENQKRLIEAFLKENPGATMKTEKTKLVYHEIGKEIFQSAQSNDLMRDCLTEPYDVQFYDENGNRLSWKYPKSVDVNE